jgi:hypothetical protein
MGLRIKSGHNSRTYRGKNRDRENVSAFLVIVGIVTLWILLTHTI